MPLIEGGPGDDPLTGTTSDDEIHGFEGNDTIFGLEGNDTIFDGDGDDLVHGGAGDDVFHEGLGRSVDTVDGGDGIDTRIVDTTLLFSPTPLTYHVDLTTGVSGSLENTLYNDVISNIENIIYIGAWNSLVIGDDLANLLQTDLGNDTIHGNGGDDTIRGGGGHDSLLGGDGNDHITDGNPGDALNSDTIDAGAGDDTIITNGGTDTFIGGAGTDTLIADVSNLTGIYEVRFNNLAGLFDSFGPSPFSYASIDGIENFTLIGSLGARVYGGDEANLFLTDEGRDTVFAGGGNDTLSGGGNNDALWGEGGNDDLSGEAGHDQLFGGTGADTLSGGEGNDRLRGDDGKDVLDGGDGVDWAIYNTATAGVTVVLSQNRVMSLPNGREIVLSTTPGYSIEDGKRADRLLAIESVMGSGHDDDITGSDLNNALSGLGGNDTIRGLGGHDTLIGGQGDDSLDGGEGRDRLYEQGGNDTFTGGAGEDTFLFGAFGPNIGTDAITDFTTGEDELWLDVFLWGGGLITVPDMLATYAQVIGGNVVLAFSPGNSITLEGISSVSDLDTGDFVLI